MLATACNGDLNTPEVEGFTSEQLVDGFGTVASCNQPRVKSSTRIVEGLADGAFFILGSSATVVGSIVSEENVPVGTLEMDADVVELTDVEVIGPRAFVPRKIFVPDSLTSVFTNHARHRYKARSADAPKRRDFERLRSGELSPLALFVRPRGQSALVIEAFDRTKRSLRLVTDVEVDIDRAARAAEVLRM